MDSQQVLGSEKIKQLLVQGGVNFHDKREHLCGAEVFLLLHPEQACYLYPVGIAEAFGRKVLLLSAEKPQGSGSHSQDMITWAHAVLLGSSSAAEPRLLSYLFTVDRIALLKAA